VTPFFYDLIDESGWCTGIDSLSTWLLFPERGNRI